MLRTLLWLSIVPFTALKASAVVTCGIQTAFFNEANDECAFDAYSSVSAACRRADVDLNNLNAVLCSCNAARSAGDRSAEAAFLACSASCNHQGCVPGCNAAMIQAKYGLASQYCACVSSAPCGKPPTSSTSISASTTSISSSAVASSSSTILAIPAIPPSSVSSPSPTCSTTYTLGSCSTTSKSGTCKRGQKAVQSPGVITTNGCGPEATDFADQALRAGLTVFASDFQQACNTHDTCFGTCSLGNDQHFDQCNTVFKNDMLTICRSNYRQLESVQFYAECLARAEVIYLAVQYRGCGPYANAQNSACQCVDCDGIETTSKVLEVYPPVDVVRTACSSAVNIGQDWASFTDAVNRASSVANAQDKATLAYYATAIGIDSASVSSQITALSSGCRQDSRRRWMTKGKKRQIVPSSRLVDFFQAFASTDVGDYGCGSTSDRQSCEVADALLGIAAVARAIDSYADASYTAIPIGTDTPKPTSMSSPNVPGSSAGISGATSSSGSSTAVVSQPSSSNTSDHTGIASSSLVQSSASWHPSASSFTTGVVTPTASTTASASSARYPEFTSSTATIFTEASTPSLSQASTELQGSTSLSTLTSVAVSNGGSAITLEPQESLSASKTADVPPEASRKATTTSSALPETSAACLLVQHYGDSPDTPDSPDGQPELPEIPDFPGGYYYLCADGSVPPLSILPVIGSETKSVQAARPSGLTTGEASPVPTGLGGCKMTRIYGDSPDTPDSPDGQPETPEILQDPSDPAYYWMCV